MTMRPLDGIRVVDLTRFLAGPYCTQELGDFGADVIKIEPLDGDGTRYQTLRPDLLGNSYFFAAANRNKRSVTIEVRKEADRTHEVVAFAGGVHVLRQRQERLALDADLRKLSVQRRCEVADGGT